MYADGVFAITKTEIGGGVQIPPKPQVTETLYCIAPAGCELMTDISALWLAIRYYIVPRYVSVEK